MSDKITYKTNEERMLGCISIAKKIHGDRYDYSLIKPFKSKREKVPIICKIHGVFHQNMNAHLGILNKKASGCNKCAINCKDSTEEIVKKFKNIHGDEYDYSLVNYSNRFGKIKIICKKHGVFEQMARLHLKGFKCRFCKNAKASRVETEWINSFKNPNIIKQYPIKINKKTYFVDGFDPQTNTVYQFHGDYYHGNPKYFKSFHTNNTAKKTFGFLYERTKTIENIFKKAGYKYIYIWESDFYKQKNISYYKKPAIYYENTEGRSKEYVKNCYKQYINVMLYCGDFETQSDYLFLLKDISQ